MLDFEAVKQKYQSKDISKLSADELAAEIAADMNLLESQFNQTRVISAEASKAGLQEAMAFLRSEVIEKSIDSTKQAMFEQYTAALKKDKKEQAAAEKKAASLYIKNTEVLLVNYRKCKSLAEAIDFDKYQDEGTFLGSEELTLETLEQQRFKTYKIIRHVDRMLAAYKYDCDHSLPEDHRRFEVLNRRYISKNKMTVPEIMDYLNVGQSTVYKDTKQAIRDMAALVFGIDAVMFKR